MKCYIPVNNKAAFCWVLLAVVAKGHCDVEVVVTKLMCGFLVKLS